MSNSFNEEIVQAIKENEAADEELAAGVAPELGQFKRKIEATFAMMGQVPNVPPFAHKLTEEHIDKILELEKAELDYTYKSDNNNRWFTFGIFFVSCCLFITLVVFLTNNNKDAILMDIVKVLFGFVGGFGVGKALKVSKKKE